MIELGEQRPSASQSPLRASLRSVKGLTNPEEERGGERRGERVERERE
jgi:hypothetical protein